MGIVCDLDSLPDGALGVGVVGAAVLGAEVTTAGRPVGRIGMTVSPPGCPDFLGASIVRIPSVDMLHTEY